MSNVDFLVKLRDATQMIADAANEQLEKMKPPEVKHSEQDFDMLAWSEKEGTKGKYEQTTKEANQNNETFRALQTILEKHKGFCIIGAWKFWTHQNDVDTIDRRKK